MQLFWQVTEKVQRTTIPELTVTFRRVTKEHYVPSEADLQEARDADNELPVEEDYFAGTNDEITVTLGEGEWMTYELGAVYGAGMGLVERESEVV